jgi:hypothetical protein
VSVRESAERPGRHLMPRTVLGTWSVAAFGVLILGAAAFFGASVSGQEGGDTLFDNLWLATPAMVAAAGTAVAMVTGWIAVLGRRERSASVTIVTVASTLVVLFVALELISG